MINILDFYKKNLTYKKLVFNKLKLRDRVIFVLLLAVFIILALISLMFLSNNILKEGGILFFITMIFEIILLKYNLYLIKNLLRSNSTFRFDKKLNEFENLKNYKAYILMDYLYEFNIRTVKQFEI